MARVVNALRKERGILDVNIDEGKNPVSLRVRFEARVAGAAQVGLAVKNALESDPNNTSPVEVQHAKEK